MNSNDTNVLTPNSFWKGIIIQNTSTMSRMEDMGINFFGDPEEGKFSMDECQTNDIPQLSDEENVLLTAPYTEEEVKRVVFQMVHNKALGRSKIFGM
jgi:hypothetical protein